MTVSPGDVLLLDTSILVDLARNNRSGKAILKNYALKSRVDRPLISVVTRGEMLGIAKSQRWSIEKITILQQLLAEFVQLEITADVVEAYSDLVALCRHQNRTMGQQNDLWIAATTKVANAVLLTGDSGFTWLNPGYIQVEYVPRQA